jgi:leader peptidase (prepilin peptidase)/N-methyltransferase
MVGIALSFAVPGLHGTCAYSLLGCLRSGAAAILGLALGSALGLWMALLGELLLGREVLGFGDVKFLGAIGAFCGWQGAIFSVFGGAMIGAVALGAAGLHRRVAGPGARPILRLELPGEAGCGPAWQAQFPFGPMLAAAGAVYFVAPHAWVDRLLAHYQALF